MSTNRILTRDLFALALLAVLVFLTASVLTYDPADPLPELWAPLSYLYQADTLVSPANTHTSNACGHWGAMTADIMLSSMGLGAYYALFSLGVVTVQLLRRRDIDSGIVRAAGWTMSLTGLATLSAMFLTGASPGPVIGAGGYLGATGRGLLEMHFATAGSVILAAGVTVAGLLLATDYTLFRMATGVGAVAMAAGLSVRGRLWGEAAPDDEAVQEEEFVEEFDEFEEFESQPTVRIGGRKNAGATDLDTIAEDEEEFEVVEEEGFEEEVEELEEPVVKKKPKKKKEKEEVINRTDGPHFKIKKKPSADEREAVIAQLNSVTTPQGDESYDLPSIEMLKAGEDFDYDEQKRQALKNAGILERTFREFGFKVKVVEIETGPVISQYEIALEPGLRLSKIVSLADDLAIALRAPSVRIVAPIPGKNSVGIEVPNEIRQNVRLREVMEESVVQTRKMHVPIFLGKDVSGNPLVADLAKLPHLLIAGRTGTGKSVCLNAIISSILMTRRPDEVRMLMIDPKMVELSGYGKLPHLMHPVVTDMKKAEAILAWAVEKMEERYSLLASAGVRHLTSYNQLDEEELYDRLQPEDEAAKEAIPKHLPFIVIVADEMADLMMTAGKEVEQHIIRLAQKSRAVGIHLILATQKPTVDVITGLIKSNLPARLAFQVASRTDSRVVLDENGADKLLGMGDMLFMGPDTSTLLRGQGTYVEDKEIDAITKIVSTGKQNFVNELVNLKVDDDEEGAGPGQLKNRDDLYEDAIGVVVREGRGSLSLLQRALGIGYGRAARLIDYMAEDKIVGEYAGSQAREVLISQAEWEKMQGLEPSEDESFGEDDDAYDDDEMQAVESSNLGREDAAAGVPAPKSRGRSRSRHGADTAEDHYGYEIEEAYD